jgi:hypothetical protein
LRTALRDLKDRLGLAQPPLDSCLDCTPAPALR